MQFLNLAAFVAALATATTAIPNFHHEDGSVSEPDPRYAHRDSTTVATPIADPIPEPDPRFAHLNLTHPYAQVHVPHGKDIEKRDIGSGTSGFGYYECSGRRWTGECQWIELERGTNRCYNARWWPNGSIGPDKGVHCTVYEGPYCNPDLPFKKGFEFPGTGDCNQYKWFGDYFTACPGSWQCAVDG